MERYRRCSLWSLWLFSLALVSLPLSARADEGRELVSGWSAFPPYSYIETVQGIPHWQGLDVELLREIARRAGYSIDFTEIDWAQHVRAIETGERDLAPQATRTPDRETFAIFSVPYRRETMVLILRRGDSASLPAGTIAELIDAIRETDLRLGIAPGVDYPSAEVSAFVTDPTNREQIVAIEERDLLESLIAGVIDGYFSDRVVAATLIEAAGATEITEEHPVMVDGDLHLMFSRASVPAEVVADFNSAIESVHADGTYRRLNAKYAFPTLVRLTLNSDWFIIVDIVGTVAFALSGLLLAIRYGYDIFGALVLASLPAVGGGVVRDLITNRETLAVLASPIYLEIVGALVVSGYVVVRAGIAIRQRVPGAAVLEFLDRWRGRIGHSVQVCDAIGLAAFTVTGVVVALATHSQPLWLWGPILASLTAAGGGILRDVVMSNPEVPSLKGELYPEIAVVWGFFLSLYFSWVSGHLDADEVAFGIGVTFLGAFLTRIAVIYFGVRSPVFRRG